MAASESAIVVGVDLAWSPRNGTGLARGVVTPESVVIHETRTATTLDEIVEFIGPHVADSVIVAIDAPTIVPVDQGMRECEKQLQRDRALQRAHAAPYPGNRSLLGRCNGGQPRGEELTDLLALTFSFVDVGCPGLRCGGRYAIEVFPAAAMVRAFGLQTPLPYKKKTGRTWEQCRRGLLDYMGRMRALESPSLGWEPAFEVGQQIGKAYKAMEDQVDAVLCAYVAALTWLGQVQMVGSVDDGYVVLPVSREMRQRLVHE